MKSLFGSWQLVLVEKMKKIITIIYFIKTQSSLTIVFNQAIAELERAIAEIK